MYNLVGRRLTPQDMIASLLIVPIFGDLFFPCDQLAIMIPMSIIWQISICELIIFTKLVNVRIIMLFGILEYILMVASPFATIITTTQIKKQSLIT